MITEIVLPTTRIGMTPINIIENLPIILKCQLIESSYACIDSLYLSITMQSKQQSTNINNTIASEIFKIYDIGEINEN